MPPARRSRTRAPLSTRRVLHAALELADRSGLDGLSMRSLASALGVEAMSLYNHVPGKERLLDGLVDLVAGEIALPAIDGDWRVELRRRAQSTHAALLRHRWAAPLFLSRINVGPNMLRAVDATIGCLVRAGFTYPLADHAWNALDSYVYGFTLQALNFPLAPGEYRKAARGFLPLIPAEEFPFLHEMSRQVIDAEHDGLHQLELGLDLLLDGLETLRSPRRGRP